MKIGISKKITFLFILLIIILGVTLGFYSLNHQKEIILGEFDERIKVLLNALAVSSEYSVLIGNEKALANIGKGILKQNDVIFCEIRNMKGDILYKGGSIDKKYFREYTFPILTKVNTELTSEELILGLKKEKTKEIGRIYLVVSISSLIKKLNEMKKTIALLVILGIVLSFTFITLLVKFTLSNPVNDLISGIKRISGGDLKYKVPCKSKDEIGELATSFNKMAEDLSKTLVSKDYVDNIISSMADSLIVTDAEGKIKTLNSATLKLFEYKKEEILNNSLDILFKDKKREERRDNRTDNSFFKNKILKNLYKNGVALSIETNCLSKNGRIIPVILNCSMIKDKEGKVVNIVCVAKDIAERKQAEEKIKTSLREKEVLLKEIHHRVKNNMQIISSLLNLQSRYIKDKKIVDMYKISRDRIRSMALIHEKLYQSEDLSWINFAQYIRDLTSHLSSSYRVNPDYIELKTDVEDVFLDINTAIPCGLIINELVTNSIKHAFPEGKTWGNGSESKGEICISLRSDKKGGKVKLIVRDNGVGFPGDLDFQNPKSLGLQLINDLVSQFDGSIELKKKNGTAFEIIFNILKQEQKR